MKNIVLSLFLFISSFLFSQVGIGTKSPSSKSILDLTATNKGFLLPRLSSVQRIGIVPSSSNDKGLQVFDTTTNSLWYWDGTNWIQQGSKNIYDNNGDIAPFALTNRTVSFSNGGSLNFDSSTLVINATSNRLGIGTTSPVSKMHLQTTVLNEPAIITVESTLSNNGVGSNTAVIRVKSQPARERAFSLSDGSIDWNIANPYTGGSTIDALSFRRNTTELMRLLSNGYFGIGTTGPTEKLDVVGAITFRGNTTTNKSSAGAIDYLSSSGATRILSWGTSSITNGAFSFQSGVANGGVTERMRIDTNGKVGIGNLAGTGNSPVYTDANGVLYRNSSSGITTAKNITSPLDANTPTNSIVTLGNISIRFNGNASTGMYQFRLNNTSEHITTRSSLDGAGATGNLYFNYIAATVGTWYNIGGAGGTPNNRDVNTSMIFLNSSKEIYRMTAMMNGDISANGSVPAVTSSSIIFVEKLD